MYTRRGVQMGLFVAMNSFYQNSQNWSFRIGVLQVKILLFTNIFVPITTKFNEFYFGIIKIGPQSLFHACTSGNFTGVHRFPPHQTRLVQRDIYSVKQKFGPSSLSRLGRDSKMFRTNKPKVPAKFGQDWARGFRKKWLQGTTGFTDL